MKHWTIIGLLIVMWAVVVFILLVPEVPNGHGFEHSRFQTMDQGGDGAQRHGPLLIAGWLFGSILIALFVSLLAWGTVVDPGRQDAQRQQRGRFDMRLTALFLGGVIYEGVFAAMCAAYRNSLTAAEASFIGPFPAGVSWLLFGVWLVPGIFIAFYVVFFHRWILPPSTLQTLAAFADHGSGLARDVTEVPNSRRKG